MKKKPDPRVVVMTGPVTVEPERAITLDKPHTIAAVIKREKIAFRLPTIAVISGSSSEPVPVLRKDWSVRKVKRGETLTFVAVPKGGNGQGKQIAGMIALIALAIAAPQIAGALFAGNATAISIASTAFIAGRRVCLDVLEAPTCE